MKTVKHTPGPWVVKPEKEDDTYLRIRGQALGHRFKIAKVLCPANEDFEQLISEWRETQANARLIAAAPDLLEALQLCLARLEPAMTELEFEAVDAARAAIAKATGGEA